MGILSSQVTAYLQYNVERHLQWSTRAIPSQTQQGSNMAIQQMRAHLESWNPVAATLNTPQCTLYITCVASIALHIVGNQVAIGMSHDL